MESSSGAKVLAGIVTRDRCQLLRRLLDSIERQTSGEIDILVVDNASSDGTSELCRSPGLTCGFGYVRMERNTGGAGGFAKVIESARESDADWVWLLDDDAAALPDTLEQLLVAADRLRSEGQPIGFLSSRVADEDDRTVNRPQIDESRIWGESLDRFVGQGLLPVESASFVSMLIPIAAVRATEPPLAHYFIWGDDLEYSLRLSETAPGWYVPRSRVLHPRPSGLPVPDLAAEPDPRRVGLYRHFFSNLVETRFRHPRRFRMARLWAAKVLVSEGAKLVRTGSGPRKWMALLGGVGRGLFRSLSWALFGRIV